MIPTRPIRALPAAALLALALTLPASAARAKPAADFGVTVIHAKKEAGRADPALKGLQKYLSGSFTRYKSFTQLEDKSVSVAQGKTGTVKLPDGKDLNLEYLGLRKGFVKVHLTLAGLKTTVNVKDGGLFFQAGRVYKGGILVLAISAKAKE